LIDALRLRIFAALWLALSLAALAHGQPPSPAAASATPDDEATPVAVSAAIRERLLLVPLAVGHDRVVQLHARLCLPNSEEPATLVLINHGSPPVPSDRPKTKLGRCDQEAAQWFLNRGYAVAFVLRRGYGETGGVADFERLGPYGADGHRLFFGPGGSAVWGPLVERYLAQRLGAISH
jgi:hypothetical protein